MRPCFAPRGGGPGGPEGASEGDPILLVTPGKLYVPPFLGGFGTCYREEFLGYGTKRECREPLKDDGWLSDEGLWILPGVLGRQGLVISRIPVAP